jgi:hypothetical protein
MLVLRYFEKDKRSIPLIQFSLYLSFPRLFPLQSIPQEGKQKGGRKKPSLTRSFDDSRLVRLSGIAVAPAVSESLHHDGKQIFAPPTPIRSSDRRHELETRAAPQNNSKKELLRLRSQHKETGIACFPELRS